jgi:hypothetical protein
MVAVCVAAALDEELEALLDTGDDELLDTAEELTAELLDSNDECAVLEKDEEFGVLLNATDETLEALLDTGDDELLDTAEELTAELLDSNDECVLLEKDDEFGVLHAADETLVGVLEIEVAREEAALLYGKASVCTVSILDSPSSLACSSMAMMV